MNYEPKRLLLIQAFTLAENSRHYLPPTDHSKEAQLMNYEDFAQILADVAWDLHLGPVAPIGDSYVETREEFALDGAARIPIVREACESGRSRNGKCGSPSAAFSRWPRPSAAPPGRRIRRMPIARSRTGEVPQAAMPRAR